MVDVGPVLKKMALIRKRIGHLVADPKPQSVGQFMDGFLTACMAFGVKAKFPDYYRVAAKRGWSERNPFKSMQDRGLSEPEIVDEIIAIHEQIIREAAERM